MKYNPKGQHHEGIGINPYGINCGECAKSSCICCINQNIKSYTVSGTIIHKNDTTEQVPPTYVESRTKNEAIRFIERVYQGTLRDIKVEQPY
jgi:hypothetical protein